MNIAIIEDDMALRRGLVLELRDAGHTVMQGESLADALRLAEQVDVVITDVSLPEADDAGIQIVREVKRKFPMVEVLVMTGYGTIPQAVEAIRLGGRTYLQKPFPSSTLLRLLGEIEQVRGLRQGISGRGGIIGSSACMRRVYAQIDVAAASDLATLIRGETGTGKELAARAIHDLSRRRSRPFVAINCAAIPRDLAESELFGHAIGAFTGATAARAGRFMLAGDGTVFLDEINSLPLDLQPKLLRVLETGEFWPVGGQAAERCQARVIAAANVDLAALADAGRFREDLMYRLDVLPVALPPLRERIEDIPAIATAIIERSNGPRAELSADTLAALMPHPWPGNVRELANVLRRAVAIAASAAATNARSATGEAASAPSAGADDSVRVLPEHLDLPEAIPDLPFKDAQERATEEWTRRTVLAALVRSEGNMTKAAAILRMDRSNIYRLIKRLGIPIPADGEPVS